MDDPPRETLCQLVAQHGPALIEDRRRCEAFLRDLCGDHHREINVLVSALDHGVPTELLGFRNSVPKQMLLARLTRHLCDDLGLAGDAARWAVDTWALAMGIEAEVPASNRKKRDAAFEAQVAGELSWDEQSGKDQLPIVSRATAYRGLSLFRIPHRMADKIIEHCRGELPIMACGILCGKNGEATHLFPCRNSELSPYRYRIERTEVEKVYRFCEEAGLSFVAVYCGYPSDDPFPSQMSIRLWYWPEAAAIIVSLKDTHRPQMKAFSIIEGAVDELAIELTEAPIQRKESPIEHYSVTD